MIRFFPLVVIAILTATAAGAETTVWQHEELKRWPAKEAKQGVAVDDQFFYAITNSEIGKYRKDTGERVGGWKGEKNGPIKHLNAGLVLEGKLYCAHSNFPTIPEESSVEIWDAATMQHIDQHRFEKPPGSLTWVDRRGAEWFACFAHYSTTSDPALSRVVKMDAQWKVLATWSFPADLIKRFAGNSSSCGAFGPEGHLFATGHDATELYVLDPPQSGTDIVRHETFPVSAEGQAFAWDRSQPGLLYSIKRSTHEVIVSRITRGPPVAETPKASEANTLQISSLGKEEQKSEDHSRAIAVALSPLAPKGATKHEAPLKADDEPIYLAKDALPQTVDGKHYDFVIVGGTGSGVLCAVRAAREGCSVLLVQHNRHIGGIMANGLMQWDALYGGPRAPLFTELLGNIEKHYIDTFGRDSGDHQIIRYTHEHYPMGWAEPHVAEREFNRLVAGEKNITLLLSHYAAAVKREGSLIKGITLREYGTTHDVHVTGTSFADATYEGDLFALAKVPYRVGREARDEYQEPHAGKIFVNIDSSVPQSVAEQHLNIAHYKSRQGSVDPTSPFTADGAVQAFNYRFCVSRDPANRLLPDKPASYNREEFVAFNRKSIATNGGPNLKSHMNSPILPGENHAYPEASWPEREKIIQRHLDFALGLMWFLQNDASISPAKRAEYREWGLAKDEFTDHGHIPYEMYVREARRIVGRHVITEQDNVLTTDYGRTPIQPDSIAFTDWYMDSHSCTNDSRPGFHYDGKLILTEESRPIQIPYRSLLPQGVDNLLVPVCLSATHVAWGAIRLEPVWMQTGEAAGFAAALAKKDGVTPAVLNADKLVRMLVERRQMVSFFNDVKVTGPEAWIPAVQYLATRGFFSSYDARANDPLDAETAKLWAAATTKHTDARQLATSLAKVKPQEPITAAAFAALLKHDEMLTKFTLTPEKPISRGDACRLIYCLTGG
ncbi:MAG: protein-xanthan lyase [Verrucomicrobiaceae bacterium]|nr:protein-xanthan lyase [Verrucomicrobiaceae bacterium]